MTKTTYDVNQVLHDCRSARFRKLGDVGSVLLSAGCAGRWYFDWIEQRVGRVDHHIGVEFYTPQPEDLPENVRWIENTVGSMKDVSDSSCDTIISGQNLEHLWPQETIGFLLESWRVLKPGGLLVIDSPNRNVTARLGWSHPEHTVEFNEEEAKLCVEAAGFDVEALHGIWLCSNPKTDEVWQLDPNIEVPEWSVTERIVSAEADPKRSFIWWLQARRAHRSPNVEAVKRLVNSVFSTAWPERKVRYLHQVGHKIEAGGVTTVVAEKEHSGALVYGPYFPLPRGSYQARFSIRCDDVSVPGMVRIDVVCGDGKEIIVKKIDYREVAGRNRDFVLDFELDKLEFGVQTRVFSEGGATVIVTLPIAISEL